MFTQADAALPRRPRDITLSLLKVRDCTAVTLGTQFRLVERSLHRRACPSAAESGVSRDIGDQTVCILWIPRITRKLPSVRLPAAAQVMQALERIGISAVQPSSTVPADANSAFDTSPCGMPLGIVICAAPALAAATPALTAAPPRLPPPGRRRPETL